MSEGTTDTNEALQALCSCVKGVYRALDLNGSPRDELAVEINCASHDGWFLLSSIDLIHGRVHELARMAAHLGPLCTLGTKKNLVDLASWLISSATEELRVIARPGHHVVKFDGQEVELFSYAGQVFWAGEAPSLRVIVDQRWMGNRAAKVAGSPEDWSRHVGSAFVGNPYLIVALGCALSAPLISPLGFPALMYGVVAASSSGKSLMLRVTQSLYRSGADLESATGTALGVQQLASEFRDMPLLLDETRQQRDADGFIRFLFDMGNNAVRKVGSASQSAVRGGLLRSALITTNEKTLDELAARQGISIDAGIQARMFEIQIEGGCGVFDRVPPGQSPAQFAERLQDSSEKYFGSVWPEWIGFLARKLQRVRGEADAYFERRRAELGTAAHITDPIGERMLRGFVAWEYSAVLAANAKLIPMSVDEIKLAFLTVLQRYQAKRTRSMTPHQQKIVDHLGGIHDLHPRMFRPWSVAGDSELPSHWGYRKKIDGEACYVWYCAALEEQMSGFGMREVALALERAGLLVHDKGERTKVINYAGHSKRFYVIRSQVRFHEP